MPDVSGAGESNEALDRSLIEHLPDFAVIIDRERRYQWVNRVAEGLRMEDVLGARVDDFVSPDALPETVRAIERAFDTGEPIQYVGRTDVVGSTPRWYLTRAVPMPEGGAVERMLLLTSDVTEQKRAELALSASEQRLEQALAAAEIGLWEWTPSRNVVRASYVWTRAAGYEGATDDPECDVEVSLERFYASIHTEDQGNVRRTLERASARDSDGFELEYRVCDRVRGTERWLLHRGRSVVRRDPSVPHCVAGTQLDVTARRETERERMSLQAQLQRAQRLESVGQLAGGVAHDFNNLLLIVLSQTELARRAWQRGEDPSEPLAEVQAASERAAELTKKLLVFSRQQGLTTEPVALGAHIEGLLGMLRRLIPETITLEHHGRGDKQGDDTATVDVGQFEQVLLNLCLNARDAMPEGGQILIETGRVDLDAGALRDHPTLTPGAYVSVRVRDTGPGIPANIREHMFEPFFTTKPPGRGTGLGLSVSDGIIRQHGGLIRVQSARGEGTTFEVLLQHSDRPTSPRSVPRTPQPRAGDETILIAEDDDMVRSLVAQILGEAGYRVLEARDGLEAVALFEEHRDSLSLVLLDAIMPNLGGRGAYERIVAQDPSARFLISSGYSDAEMPDAMLAREHLQVLHKPYAPDVLLRAVRAALDAEPPGTPAR